jgi:hypothetical protein
MKQRLIAFIAAMIVATVGFAQSHSNVITTAPLGIAFGNYNLKYEKTIGTTSSILVGGNFQTKFLGVDISGLGGNLAYRYYITNKGKDIPSGFYVMPGIKYNSYTADIVTYENDGFTIVETTTKATATDFQIGGELGYQWAWSSGFALDLGVGAYNHSLGGEAEGIGFEKIGSFTLPRFSFSIGYAF